MEFDFSINPLIGDVISRVDHRILPFDRTSELYKERRRHLLEVLDRMGDASAKAQGLHGAITSGRKLEHSDHHVYLMKDSEANRFKGAVVGFIKVGHKKLFVYDNNGCQHEMEPLCVLDFYVHESRQRIGCGKRLFQHMLQCEMVKPFHLAIDRPSLMFTGFLQKHYGLHAPIPQVNNFVVFEGFFKNRTDGPVRGVRNGSAGRPPTFPYRRPSANRSAVYDPTDRQRKLPATTSDHPLIPRPPSARKDNSVPVPASEQHDQEKALLRDVRLRPPSGKQNSETSSTYSHQDNVPIESLHLNLTGLVPVRERAMIAGVNRYSRHGRSSATPPPRFNSANRSRQNSANQPQQQLQQNLQNQQNHISAVIQSGQNGTCPTGKSTPPLLRRGVTPVSQLDYMSRDGHLKVKPQNNVSSLPLVVPTPMHPPPSSDTTFPGALSDTTWTVFGIIPNGYHRQFSQKKYHHTRLW